MKMFDLKFISWGVWSTLLLQFPVNVSSSSNSGSRDLCDAFAPGNLTDVIVTATHYYAANTTVHITNDYSSIDVDNLPAFCRVELTITTNVTANSSCKTEVWLPDEWNDRLMTVGNGGFAGGGKPAG